MRHVGRLGARQSSAGSITYGLRIVGRVRQPWIASPHINSTYRKCGGGFAKTDRGKPCPVPAQCAGTVDEVTPHGAGNHPAACGRHPSTEGIGVGRELRAVGLRPRYPRPRPRPYPLCGGVPPQRRGGSPAGRNPTKKLNSPEVHYAKAKTFLSSARY
ncbi:MAG: hypothetical protein LBM98_01470 [Oscillospiraceae bacterium]|nr:hypothetical protein [Oscillospiraceae bacterium]